MSRYRFTFWLDASKDNELLLCEEIDAMKRARKFVGTIRQGLELMIDLKAGRTEVLFRLFPWVKESLHKSSPPPTSPFDVTELFERFERMMKETRSIPDYGVPAMKPSKLQKVLALPTFDDDDDTIAPTRKAGAANGGNLLGNIFNVMG